MIIIGLNFFKLLRPQNGESGTTDYADITCSAFEQAAQEYQIRELCFWTCVNMIANSLGRCEVKTYRAGKLERGREYYMWNVEPNANQNATAFFHKLVARLCQDNEALIISTGSYNGHDTIAVADDWEEPEDKGNQENRYRGVTLGNKSYDKTFRERDIMHLKLNHMDIKPVIDAMFASYVRLVQAAMKSYEWENGQHWKVKINQIAQNGENWHETFQKMLASQIRPFMESPSAVLPVFDGYEYEDASSKQAVKSADRSREAKKLIEDIFDFTARGFGIPAVLINGTVEGVKDAQARYLTGCIDPICDQLSEEGTRKRFGYEGWSRGDYLRVDSSAIIHFDLFSNAANIEKLVGSGAFSLNDVLRAAGQATINEPWADEHYMTKNIGLVEELLNGDGKGGEGNGE